MGCIKLQRESIDLMKLGASMVFLSVLITYVIFSFLLGKDIGNESLNKIDNIQISSQTGALDELNNMETVMSSATAFSLFEYYHEDIRQITCYVCDTNGEIRTIDKDLCIHSHLKGYVKVSVEYNNSYGLYDIVIRPA